VHKSLGQGCKGLTLHPRANAAYELQRQPSCFANFFEKTHSLSEQGKFALGSPFSILARVVATPFNIGASGQICRASVNAISHPHALNHVPRVIRCIAECFCKSLPFLWGAELYLFVVPHRAYPTCANETAGYTAATSSAQRSVCPWCRQARFVVGPGDPGAPQPVATGRHWPRSTILRVLFFWGPHAVTRHRTTREGVPAAVHLLTARCTARSGSASDSALRH